MKHPKLLMTTKFGTIAAMFIAAALLQIAGPVALAEDDDSVEEEFRVHRLGTTETAPYDAFAYLNRINTEVGDEDPKEFAGRLFGRLANQEGRVLLKLPPGFTAQGYDGLKVFYRTDGGLRSGNCVSCHKPSLFTDLSSHFVDESKTSYETPTLRNLEKSAPYLHDDSAKTLEEVLKQKVRMNKLARESAETTLDAEYKVMNISEDDIPALAEFLKTLNEVGKEGFREMVMKAEILDTSDMY